MAKKELEERSDGFFPRKCFGRDAKGNEVLEEPVDIGLYFGETSDEKNRRVFVYASCRHSHIHRHGCNASGKEVYPCPYVVILPEDLSAD